MYPQTANPKKTSSFSPIPKESNPCPLVIFQEYAKDVFELLQHISKLAKQIRHLGEKRATVAKPSSSLFIQLEIQKHET
jgi:hypothetical protein